MPNNWPPQPNNNANNTPNPPPTNPTPTQMPPQYVGKEWQLLEKTLLASIEEQKRARRWSIFFKLLTFGYVLLLGVVMAKGCTHSNKNLENLDKTKPHLAVVNVEGVISADKDANSERINKALTKAFDNEQAKAVALRINSPGGSPVQSDEIWQTMTELRKAHPNKKLYAVIEDMGASGAYYIASGADEIWVNPSSLVGSIGVILPRYDVQELMKKVGVKDGTIHSGEYKDILSMSRDMTEFEKTHVQGVLDNTHQHFINAVKQGRGNRLKDPEANHLFTGLFWSGEQAIGLGLADKAGSISSLEKQLKLEDSVDYTPTDPMEKLFGKFASQMGQGMGETMSENMAKNIASQLGNNANDNTKIQ